MQLLECINLNKNFGNKKVLEDINLTVPKGKIIGLFSCVRATKSSVSRGKND